jgi:hypothetical protein
LDIIPLALWFVQIQFDRTSGIVQFLASIQIDGLTGSPNLELRELLYMRYYNNPARLEVSYGAVVQGWGGFGGAVKQLLLCLTMLCRES